MSIKTPILLLVVAITSCSYLNVVEGGLPGKVESRRFLNYQLPYSVCEITNYFDSEAWVTVAGRKFKIPSLGTCQVYLANGHTVSHLTRVSGVVLDEGQFSFIVYPGYDHYISNDILRLTRLGPQSHRDLITAQLQQAQITAKMQSDPNWRKQNRWDIYAQVSINVARKSAELDAAVNSRNALKRTESSLIKTATELRRQANVAADEARIAKKSLFEENSANTATKTEKSLKLQLALEEASRLELEAKLAESASNQSTDAAKKAIDEENRLRIELKTLEKEAAFAKQAWDRIK